MTMPAYDAWVLARLRSGQPADGEPDDMAERFKPIAATLAVLPVEGRGAAWSGWLAGQADRDALNRAVAEADPLGPRPDPSGPE
ncbi:hypothetical protein, partial [Paludisphaera soli]|uniref:hypothetical protein n=1 Tax=Paludisphaera soli TaxID=2712865 RepID=UPI0013EB83DF